MLNVPFWFLITSTYAKERNQTRILTTRPPEPGSSMLVMTLTPFYSSWLVHDVWSNKATTLEFSNNKNKHNAWAIQIYNVPFWYLITSCKIEHLNLHSDVSATRT